MSEAVADVSTSEAAKPKVSKSFCFTKHDYEPHHPAMLLELVADGKADYVCFGKEVCPTTQKKHLQGFISFNRPKSWKLILNLMPKATFVDACKGTPEQNIKYCSKEGAFSEAGVRPLTPCEVLVRKQQGGEIGGAKEQLRWSTALAGAQAGHFDDIDPQIQVCHMKSLDYIFNKEELKTKLFDTELVCYWFFGASGTGKSRYAREMFPEFYLKPCNKWWDGIKIGQGALVEDFDVNHNVLCHHMKIWADRYAFVGEAKGRSLKIRPPRIVVTSNYHPSQIWHQVGDLEPIMRRFTCVNFNKRDDIYGMNKNGSACIAIRSLVVRYSSEELAAQDRWREEQEFGNKRNFMPFDDESLLNAPSKVPRLVRQVAFSKIPFPDLDAEDSDHGTLPLPEESDDEEYVVARQEYNASMDLVSARVGMTNNEFAQHCVVSDATFKRDQEAAGLLQLDQLDDAGVETEARISPVPEPSVVSDSDEE